MLPIGGFYFDSLTLLYWFDLRAAIQKYFRSFFGANENFKICFRDLLTFSNTNIYFLGDYSILLISAIKFTVPTITPKIALNGVKVPQFPNLLNQGWIELNFQ